jgi:hypothetical protein
VKYIVTETKLSLIFSPNTQGASHIMVTYTKAKKADGDGRWFSKCMGSMQGMSRGVRQTICKDMWIDLDFVNCHPVLLSQLCKKLRYEIVFLIDYGDQMVSIISSLTHTPPKHTESLACFSTAISPTAKRSSMR